MSKESEKTRRFFVKNSNEFYEKLYPNVTTNLIGIVNGLIPKFAEEIQTTLYVREDLIPLQIQFVSTKTLSSDITSQEGTMHFSTRTLATIVTYLIGNQDFRGVNTQVHAIQKNKRVYRTRDSIIEVLKLISFIGDKDDISAEDLKRKEDYNQYITKLFLKNEFIKNENAQLKEGHEKKFELLSPSSKNLMTILQLNDQMAFQFIDQENISEENFIERAHHLAEKNKEFKVIQENNFTEVSARQISNVLQELYSKIQKDFSSIDLLLPSKSNFSSMDSFIDLELKSPRVINYEKIRLLKLQFENTSDHQERSKIADEIADLEIEEPTIGISTIINRNEHVYIKGPAGSGKSTLLRWSAFACTQGTLYFAAPRIPIYVELKFYREQGDLATRINSFIKKYNIKHENFQEFGVLLLLDGFDEFHHDEVAFFNELTEWIGDKKVQIIFAGRERPKFSDKLLQYSTFEVNPITLEHIKSALFSNLGSEQGAHWSGIIEANGLEHYLTNPLYLTFVISTIQEKQEHSEIENLIVNKGKLLSTLIINQFMNFEKSKNHAITEREWIQLKSHLIKSLACLAYEMTFKSKNAEIISQKNAMSIVKDYIDNIQKLSSQDIIDILCFQNFLKMDQSEDSLDVVYTFVKKEIRLFFASYYLSKIVTKRRHFRRTLDSLTKWPKAQSTISSIEEYTLGLVKPEIILSKKFLNSKKDFVFYSPRLIQNFRYLITLVQNGNLKFEEIQAKLDKCFHLIKELIESYIIYEKTLVENYSGDVRLFRSTLTIAHTRIQLFFLKNKQNKKIRRLLQMSNGFLITIHGGPEKLLERFVEYSRHYSLTLFFDFFDMIDSIDSWHGDFNSKIHFTKNLLIEILLSSEHFHKLSVSKKLELSYLILFEKNNFGIFCQKYTHDKSNIFQFIRSYPTEFWSYFVDLTPLNNTKDYFSLFDLILARGMNLFSLDSTKMSSLNKKKWVYILTQTCLAANLNNINAYWRVGSWSKMVDSWYVEKITEKLKFHLAYSKDDTKRILAAKSLIHLGHLQYISVLKEYINPNVPETYIREVIIAVLHLNSGMLPSFRILDAELTRIFLPILDNEQFSVELKKHFLEQCGAYCFFCTPEIQNAAMKMYFKTFISSNMSFSMIYFMKYCNGIEGRIEFLKEYLSSEYLWANAYGGILHHYIYNDYNPSMLKQYKLKIEPFWKILVKNLLIIHSLEDCDSQSYWLIVAGLVGDQDIFDILESIDKDQLEPNTLKDLEYSRLQIEMRLRRIRIQEKNRSRIIPVIKK